MALIKCNECGKEVSSNAVNCPNCGNPINTKMRCPKCGGTNTRPISGASKTVSMLVWGPLAANKILSSNECLDCKHKFK